MKFLSIKPILLGLIATGLAISHTYAMDPLQEDSKLNPFEIKELRDIIVNEAAIEQALINKPLTDLASVSKEWLQIVKTAARQVKGPLWKVLQGVADKEDEATYQAFLNVKLVYRPIPDSNVGMIELKISDFSNPFKGTFDLSQCGDTAKHLTITTDPFVFFQINKEHRQCNILIAPYFLIKKHLTYSVKSFEEIMKEWNKNEAQVGIFCRCSDHKDLSEADYLITKSLSDICSTNLFENWCAGEKWYCPYRLRLMDNVARRYWFLT